MTRAAAVVVLLGSAVVLGAPAWQVQTSGVTARLRGVSAASARVAYASGSGATILTTTDAGETWTKLAPPADGAGMDFRDVDAVSVSTAYLLSIGEGDKSRIYKTTDAGASWTKQYANSDPKGFLDAMSFWDASHGLVIGDSIDKHFQILTTSDGGARWTKVPDAALPPALDNEGAFSGSGTNIAVIGKTHAWIGTGAAARCRVLFTTDAGRTWQVVDTPIAATASAGIFSVAFRDERHGVIVGGDYRKEKEAVANLAITRDGGRTWTLVSDHALSGFRSVVAFVPGTAATWIAVGPQGGDISVDDGVTWTPLPAPGAVPGFDTLSFAPGSATAFAAGARGAIARFSAR